MIRVVLAEDDGIIRSALAALLRLMNIDVVGEAEDGRQAVSIIEKRKPDVALFDVKMPRASGLDAVLVLRSRGIQTPVIFLTTFDDRAVYTKAVRAGIHGWLLKGEEAEDLVKAIEDVAAGRTRLIPSLDVDDDTGKLPPLPEDLTPRETEVLRLVARGLNNATIARGLGTALGTVKNQVSSILQKLGAESRLEAVRVAAKRRIL